MPTLKQAQSDLLKVSRELGEAEANQRNLKEKREGLKVKREGFQDQLEQARAQKENALDAFVRDESKESVMNRARNAYEQLSREFEQTDELLEAYERAIDNGEGQIPALRSAVEKAQQLVAWLVREELMERIRNQMGDVVAEAFVAARKSTRHMSLESFLDELFGPSLKQIDTLDGHNAFNEKYFVSA